MKIGIIRETKIPVDNRVALSPAQTAYLAARYPDHRILVQSSTLRVFSDEGYRERGITVVEDVSDCDVLFGIKEVRFEFFYADVRIYFGEYTFFPVYGHNRNRLPKIDLFFGKQIKLNHFCPEKSPHAESLLTESSSGSYWVNLGVI